MKPDFCSKHTKAPRLRTIKRIRCKIKNDATRVRLTITRTSKHICAQIFEFDGSKVLACASSLDKEIRENIPKEGGKIAIAKLVGALVANKAKEKGIKRVAVDRSGFKYHGRIKGLVEAVREAGIQC